MHQKSKHTPTPSTSPQEADTGVMDTQALALLTKPQDVAQSKSSFNLEEILDQKIGTLSSSTTLPPGLLQPLQEDPPSFEEEKQVVLNMESDSIELLPTPPVEGALFTTMELGSTSSATLDMVSEALMLEALLQAPAEPLSKAPAPPPTVSESLDTQMEVPTLANLLKHRENNEKLPDSLDNLNTPMELPDSLDNLSTPIELSGLANLVKYRESDEEYPSHSKEALDAPPSPPCVESVFDRKARPVETTEYTPSTPELHDAISFSGSFEDLASMSAPAAFRTFLPPLHTEAVPVLTVPQASDAMNIGGNVAELETWGFPPEMTTPSARSTVETSVPQPSILSQVRSKPFLAPAVHMDRTPPAQSVREALPTQENKVYSPDHDMARTPPAQSVREALPTQESKVYSPDHDSLSELPVVAGLALDDDEREPSQKVSSLTEKGPTLEEQSLYHNKRPSQEASTLEEEPPILERKLLQTNEEPPILEGGLLQTNEAPPVLEADLSTKHESTPVVQVRSTGDSSSSSLLSNKHGSTPVVQGVLFETNESLSTQEAVALPEQEFEEILLSPSEEIDISDLESMKRLIALERQSEKPQEFNAVAQALANPEEAERVEEVVIPPEEENPEESSENILLEDPETDMVKPRWTPPPQPAIQRVADPEPSPEETTQPSPLLYLLLLILFSLGAISLWLLAALRS